MKKEIDCWNVTVKIVIRKDYFESEFGSMTGSMTGRKVKDLVQQGIEVPIEEIAVEVRE